MAKRTMIDAVLKEYQMRQDIFQVKCDNILNELFIKHPKLCELRKKYASLRRDERNHRNDDKYKQAYKKIYDRYQKLFDQCLEKENVSIYEVVYQSICKQCNDTGYIGEFEKKLCSCVIAQAAQNIMESSSINNKETLNNFDLNIFNDTDLVFKNQTQRQLMKKMYDYLLSWTNEFPNCIKKQLLIIGNVGLGKSYCLNSIAYEIIKKGFSAMMVTSFAINEAAFDEIKKSDSTALNMMRSVDLLLIDDLGSEQVLNNITCPTLFNILNERIRRNLHTIVSTNLNIDKLEEKYGPRVSSRLTDKHRTFIPPIKGKDVRSKF